jgi:hypothetical protein
MRYQVQIAAANVPEELAGAPLSVEIISQAGNARRVLLPLSSTPVIQDVDEPGSYFIRATLPSGRLIAYTATTPETPNLQGDARCTVVVDLKEHDATSDFWREAQSLLQIATAIQSSRAATGAKDQRLPAWLVSEAHDLVKRAWGSTTASIASGIGRLLETVGLLSAPIIRADTSQPARPKSTANPPPIQGTGDSSTATAVMSYDWGTFVRWDSAPEKHSHRFEIPKMVLRRGGSGTVGPHGEIMPPWTQGSRIEPHFIKVTEAPTAAGSLIVWSPGPTLRPARVVPDHDAAIHHSGSPLMAFLDPVDSTTATLFSYVRRGAIEEARTAVPALLSMLKRDTVLGPNQGLFAAYVLYKLRDRNVDELILRLCTQYPELPDVHILAASQLISDGKINEAIEPLRAALARGAPVYTEGVRLLRDGSNFFRDFRPDEEYFQNNARQAASIAAAANFQSDLTCLRMGDDLVMEFVDV